MRWGFDRFGHGAIACAVLAPAALCLLIRGAAHAYCQRQEDRMVTRRCMLDSLPDMTNACAAADRSLALFHGDKTGASGGPEELGRWLRATGIRNSTMLQALTVGNVGADPVLPALRATFRTEQQADRLLPFLRDLEQAPWLVTYDAIRLRKPDPPVVDRYAADVILQACALALPAGGEAEKGTGP